VAVALLGLTWPQRWRDRAAEQQLVADTKMVLRRLRAAGVPKIIVAQNTALYGNPAGDPPDPLSETAPVRGHRVSAYARARAQVADFLDLFERDYAGMLTRLRSAWIVGPHHLALARLCAKEPVLACGYEDYVLPVVHEADLVRALAFAVTHDLPGVYHVGAAEGLRFHEVAALVGKQHACTPLPWLVLRAWGRWRWLRWRTPPLWVRALHRGAGLDVRKLRAAGWSPQVTARAAFNEALDVYRVR
jgi:UDP-glucose 4-epimerase